MNSLHILRLFDEANYTRHIKELNTEFKNYSKIFGRDFMNPMGSEIEIGSKLLYLEHQGVSLTIAI